MATAAELITQLYVGYYNRAPDPEGLSYWIGVYNSGKSIKDIAEYFALQDESKATYPYLAAPNVADPSLFVEQIYQNLFGRAATAADKAYWVGELNAHHVTAGAFIATIQYSANAAGTGPDFTTLKNKTTVGLDYATELANSGVAFTQASAHDVISGVNANDNSVTEGLAKTDAFIAGGVVGETFTLTVNPDGFTGTANNDTFVASEATLSSADVLDGGKGNDVLRYASSGAAAVNEAGFTTTNIETIEVISDAVGGTVFDVTGTSGVTSLVNSNSSQNLQLVGLGALTSVTLKSVSGGDTTVIYKDSVLAGTADAQTLLLTGNQNNAGAAVSNINIGNATSGGTAGLETLNIETSGLATKLVDITTGAKTINIKGDQSLSITNTLEGATLIDASTATGAINVKADSGALAVVVKGGAGNDTADFSNGFGAGDSFDGGAGTDTIGLTNALATGVLGGTTTSVEQLNITDAGAGTVDASKFAGVTRITYDAGLGADAVVSKATSGITVEVDVTAAAKNLTVQLATDGAADVVTVELDDIQAGDAIGTVTVADAETFNLVVDDDTTNATGTLAIGNLSLNDATKIVVTGDAKTTIAGFTAPATAITTTFDASGTSGGLNLTGLGGMLAAAGSTVTLGSGADVINGGTGLGADSITLGAGKDTVFYTAVAQSSAAKVDTVQDFKVGEDIIDVSAFGVVTKSQFVGNFASFGAAQGAITAGGAVEAVFDSSTSTLWVDANNDGTLNANDLQIVLKGVTAITEAELGIVPGVTFTANKPAFNTTLTADSVEGTKVGAADDIIIATAAQIPGSTITGGVSGTDTLRVTTDATGLTLDGTVRTSIEKIDLQAGSSGNVTVNQAAVTSVINSSATDGSTVTLAAANVATNFTGGVKNDTLNLQGAAYTKALAGGDGTDSLNVVAGTSVTAATVSGFEILNVATNGGVAASMTAAQHNAFISINATAFNDTIALFTPAGNATVQGDADIATYQFDETGGTFNFTLGAFRQNVTEIDAGTKANTYSLGFAGAYTGTFTNLDNEDTLQVVTGTDITGINAGAAVGAGLLNLTGAITMTEAQHDAFDGGSATSNIIAAGLADKVSIASGAIISINTDADVETYVIGNDTGNDGFTVKIRGASQVIDASASNDAGDKVTFSFDTAGFTFSGTITGEATGNDVLSLRDGDNLSAATINAVEDLTLANNASVTLNGATYNGFTGTITAAGTETVTISNSGTYAAKAMIENYVLAGSGNDTFNIDEATDAALTDTVRGGMSVSLSGGGTDTLNIKNATIVAAADSSVTVTNFTAGAAGDVFHSFVGATQHNAGFQEITAGATNLTVGANSVIEINTAVAEAINLADVAAGGGIESILANAIANAASGDYTVAIYQGANAGIYQINTTAAGADLTATNTTVELIGILQNVGANALTSGNFL